MAHFYGSIQGARGEATRLGHASSGLSARAYSYAGGVSVDLYVRDGKDFARVSIVPHPSAEGPSRLIYDGPVDDAARSVDSARFMRGMNPKQEA